MKYHLGYGNTVDLVHTMFGLASIVAKALGKNPGNIFDMTRAA